MAAIPKSIGRYDIITLVGRGGMGLLYKGRDPKLERDVAVKVMLVDFTVDPAAHERFQREAKAVARLQHRNVVTIHELGETDGTPYIVMEFLTGQDLETRMKSVDKPMTLTEKLDVASQLCEGLGYAHEQGIVHRDIKPGNVRVLEDNTVKILDFGIAKFAMSSVTQSGTILGTASYMAPEQIMGQPVDGRADLFSAGVLLFELLTGKKPFAAETPTAVVYQIMHTDAPSIRSINPDLPEALDEIVARALKKNPDERYSRASEMAADLQMVKMMLDPPLHSTDPGTVKPITGQLHAVSIGSKVAAADATVVRNTPMRASKEAAAADAAARLDARKTGPSAIVYIVGGGFLIAAALAAYFAFHGSGTAQTGGTNTGNVAAGGATSGGGAGTPARGGAATRLAIAIDSTPAGAKITLNGTDTGRVTPAAIEVNTGQANTFELTLKGYETAAATLSDADIKAGNKEFKMTRAQGPVKLGVSWSLPFELVRGDKVISAAATRHEVTVEPGGANVVARNRQYGLSQTLNIDFGRSSADITLPQPGSLSIVSPNETCNIFVDGQDEGPPPLPKKVVASGSHNVQLKCPDGKSETQRVSVSPNENVRVSLKGSGRP
jgi:serine/threonine-protein kinase